MKTRLLAAAALLLLSASAALADANPPPVVTGWSGCLTAPGRNQFGMTGQWNNPNFVGNGGQYGTFTYTDGRETTGNLNASPYGVSVSTTQTNFGTFVGSGMSACANPVEFATTASVNTTINNLYQDIKNIQNGGTIGITPTNVTNYSAGGTQIGGAQLGAATQSAVIIGVAHTQTNAANGGADVSNMSALVPH